MVHPLRQGGQLLRLLRGAAPLALLPGDVDLQQDVLHQAQLARLAVDGLKQPLGVHRVDQRRLSHYLLDLVGLEVADEMDLGPGIGAGGQVSGELLDPVLAAHRNPRGDGLTDGIVRLHLGGGAQGDLPRVPPRRPGGGGDGLFDCIDVLLNRHFRSLFLYFCLWLFLRQAAPVRTPAAFHRTGRCPG